MTRAVVIVDPEEQYSKELCAVLEREKYRAVALTSLEGLDRFLQSGLSHALILDLDHAQLDNRSLRGLRRENRQLCIIGLSSRSFHPELKEALSQHIDACFAKPVDWDDLVYYLKGALRNSQSKLLPPGSGAEERRS